jgi:hypothetical protein
MIRILMVVALCFINSSPLFAQRHGRADSIENFARQGRLYVCSSDLRKMSRTVVVLKDAATGISHKFEGVALEYLLSDAGLGFGSETINISYGNNQNTTVLDGAIPSNSQILVADTID